MTPDLDSVLAAAQDIARVAAVEAADADSVGAHAEVVPDGDFVVTHYFENTSVAYRGWRWAVTLTRVPDSEDITIDEVVLLPGVDSLLAPAWVPWNDRIRPGDLSPGDLLPTELEDPRLEPGFTGSDALDEIDDLTTALGPLRPEQWQLGLGRERVLSAWGREDAADRWDAGDFGPDAPMAKSAPGHCHSCGFVIRIGGSLGQAFGLCANAFGADGRVVSLNYGCGAHSSVRPIEGTGIPVTEMAVDEILADELTLDPIATASTEILDLIDPDEADEMDVAVIADEADDEEGAVPEEGLDDDVVAYLDEDDADDEDDDDDDADDVLDEDDVIDLEPDGFFS